MTLEDAVKRLGERGYALEWQELDGRGNFGWVVIEANSEGSWDRGVGKTWQAAYAEAMNEAPF